MDRYKTQHMGRLNITLTTGITAITSIANHYTFSYIFDCELEAMAQKEDEVLCISNDGKSVNAVNTFFQCY